MYAGAWCFVVNVCDISEWCMLKGDLKDFACRGRSGRRDIAMGVGVVG